MKIRPVRVELFHADGRIYRHDEADSRFSNFFFYCSRLAIIVMDSTTVYCHSYFIVFYCVGACRRNIQDIFCRHSARIPLELPAKLPDSRGIHQIRAARAYEICCDCFKIFTYLALIIRVHVMRCFCVYSLRTTS